MCVVAQSRAALPVSSMKTSSSVALRTCRSEIATPRASTSAISAATRACSRSRVVNRARSSSHARVVDARRSGARSAAIERRRGRRATRTAARSIATIEILRRAGGDDLAVIDDRDAIAELFGFFDVVRRQQHGVAVLLHPRDFAVQLAPGLRVEARRRLVEEDELGSVHECQREREPLPLAARERVERRVGLWRRARSVRAVSPGVDCRGRTTPKSVSASRGVILSCSAVVCSAAPIFCFTSRGCRRASMPQTSIVAGVRLAQADRCTRRVVVLPDPFGPSSPKISPSRDLEATRRARPGPSP